MPEISRFFGIIIYIYYDDHNPPHFHAVYNEYSILISIDSLGIISGYLPPKALGLVMEWAVMNKIELKKVWQQAMEHQKLDKITPLR